jgi:hypothetical protein
MSRLLLPDAGPLFSFAAGEILDVGLIPSATQAEMKIRLRRPHFQAERWIFTGGLS